MRNGVPGYAGDASLASGPAIGQVSGVEGPVAANNAHYAQVQADASGASGRIAALQTIKSEVPTANMGKGYLGDWLRQVSKIFGANVNSNTSLDVMAKNLAVLAAQGGNTDASRTLGEMGTPGYKMTGPAAVKTSDQLIGIDAKKLAAEKLFSGMKTNDPQYAQRKTQWDAAGDPRAFEFAAKSPEDQAKMKAELVKAGTWSGLASKMRALHGMGIEP